MESQTGERACGRSGKERAGRVETGHSRRHVATEEAALASAVRACARGELHGGGSAGGRCQTAQGLSLGLHGELRGWGAQREGPSVCSQLIHCAVHRNQHHTVEQCSN